MNLEIVVLALSLINFVLLLVLLLRRNPAVREKELKAALRELAEDNRNTVDSLGQALQNNQSLSAQMQDARLDSLEEKMNAQMNAQHVLLESIQKSVTTQMEQFRTYNVSQLEQLEKTLSEDEKQLREGLTELGQALQANQNLSTQMQDKRLIAFEEKFSSRLESLTSALRAQLSAYEEQVQGQLRAFETQLTTELTAQHKLVETLQSSVSQRIEQFNASSGKQLQQLEKTLSEDEKQLRTELTDRLSEMLGNLRTLQKSNEEKLEQMRSSMSEGMRQLREENGKKLDEIRGTVDEKLQTTLEKRISESFKTVSEQLEQVYKGIGEMQTLASDVGGLKKVLSGVKTRGILGEVQLGAILEEILSPEQYETNVATIPGSSERVEYAIRLPGKDGVVYLPIDSKFPGDRYEQLRNAQEEGDKEKIEIAYRNLEQVIKSEARDIRNKYVEVPYTTNFGVMFLPFEGLYAEVVNRGLIEKLQQEYRISVAGPSTMAALLNSLQMGFRTLAIQKRSNEVWEVLGAVKTEFEKFGEVMKKMQTHLTQTSNDLDTLMGTRSKAIERKLRSIQKLDEADSRRLLESEDDGL